MTEKLPDSTLAGLIDKKKLSLPEIAELAEAFGALIDPAFRVMRIEIPTIPKKEDGPDAIVSVRTAIATKKAELTAAFQAAQAAHGDAIEHSRLFMNLYDRKVVQLELAEEDVNALEKGEKQPATREIIIRQRIEINRLQRLLAEKTQTISAPIKTEAAPIAGEVPREEAPEAEIMHAVTEPVTEVVPVDEPVTESVGPTVVIAETADQTVPSTEATPKEEVQPAVVATPTETAPTAAPTKRGFGRFSFLPLMKTVLEMSNSFGEQVRERSLAGGISSEKAVEPMKKDTVVEPLTPPVVPPVVTAEVPATTAPPVEATPTVETNQTTTPEIKPVEKLPEGFDKVVVINEMMTNLKISEADITGSVISVNLEKDAKTLINLPASAFTDEDESEKPIIIQMIKASRSNPDSAAKFLPIIKAINEKLVKPQSN